MSQQIAFQGSKEIITAMVKIAGGAAGAGAVGSVASGSSLLPFLAVVAPYALPFLAVGGAIALIASLASEDEKKE